MSGQGLKRLEADKHTHTYIQMCSDWSQTRQLHRHRAQIECDFDFSPHFIRNCQIRFHSDDISFTVPQPLWFCFLKKSDGENIRQLLPSTRSHRVSVVTLPLCAIQMTHGGKQWSHANALSGVPPFPWTKSVDRPTLNPCMTAASDFWLLLFYCCCSLENVLRNKMCAPGGKTYCVSQFKYICTILWHFVV